MSKTIDLNQALKDRKILEKNASKIMSKLLKGYGFTPEEMNNINSRYSEQTEYKKIVDWLRNGSEREKLLADLYFATEIDNLERVNNIIAQNVKRLTEEDIRLMKILGMFE